MRTVRMKWLNDAFGLFIVQNLSLKSPHQQKKHIDQMTGLWNSLIDKIDMMYSRCYKFLFSASGAVPNKAACSCYSLSMCICVISTPVLSLVCSPSVYTCSPFSPYLDCLLASCCCFVLLWSLINLVSLSPNFILQSPHFLLFFCLFVLFCFRLWLWNILVYCHIPVYWIMLCILPTFHGLILCGLLLSHVLWDIFLLTTVYHNSLWCMMWTLTWNSWSASA